MNRLFVSLLLLGAVGCASQQKVATREETPPPAPAPVAKPAPAPAPAPAPVAKKEPPTFNGATIHFGFNESTLTEEGMTTLRSLAETLRANDVLRIRIEGHADERGTTEYNLALGNRRADAARRYLVTLGVPEDRVSIISYGEERPKVTGSSEDAYATNRRGEIVPQ